MFLHPYSTINNCLWYTENINYISFIKQNELVFYIVGPSLKGDAWDKNNWQ